MGHQRRVAGKSRFSAGQRRFISADATGVRRPYAFRGFADRLMLRIQVLTHGGDMGVFRATAIVGPGNGRICGASGLFRAVPTSGSWSMLFRPMCVEAMPPFRPHVNPCPLCLPILRRRFPFTAAT